MARKWKKEIRFYDYECSLTGEKFRMTKEAKNPKELISVKAYYELHPEKDDRPEVIKKKVKAEEITRASYTSDETETVSESSPPQTVPESSPPQTVPESSPPQTVLESSPPQEEDTSHKNTQE